LGYPSQEAARQQITADQAIDIAAENARQLGNKSMTPLKGCSGEMPHVLSRHRRDRLLSLVALTDAGLIGLLAAYRH
jgi:hypothetical protein